MRRFASRRRARIRLLPLLPVLAMVLILVWVGLGCSTFQAARLYQSGTGELQRGDYDQAIADLERAAALAPQMSEIQNHLGLALVGAGREQEAERAFERAVALDCENEAAAENLAILAPKSPPSELAEVDAARAGD